MLIGSFIEIIKYSVISAIICGIGVIISYFFQEDGIAFELFKSYVFHFNGILIMGFSYGLLFFVKKNNNMFFNQLLNIVDIPFENQKTILGFHRKATSWKFQNLIAIPITIVGGAILLGHKYPLEGFAKFHLAIFSISIYYCAGILITYFLFYMNIFRHLDNSYKNFKIKKGISYLDFESLNSFLIITSTIGIIAIYLAFRGTLTANFLVSSTDSSIRKLLIFPIVSFLSAPLIVSFYPRFVLKKIYENDLLQKIKDFEENRKLNLTLETSLKEKLELEKLVFDIKEKILMEKNKFPIFNIKDSPSLFIFIVMIIQYLFQQDSVINDFIKSLFR